MKAIEIKQENVTEAFKSADGCEVAINILTNLFGKQKPDYTDFHNIKTYEDACEALGIKPVSRLLIEYGDGQKEEVIDIAHIAYVKLSTIARALNNDPEFPRFTENEYRWFPWYYLYSQEEIDDMDEEKRKGLVFWGGNASDGAFCGLAYAYSLRLVVLVCGCRLSPCCKIRGNSQILWKSVQRIMERFSDREKIKSMSNQWLRR
nr:MAG TPA: hypothetical protein [Bacteriophage sp.]